LGIGKKILGMDWMRACAARLSSISSRLRYVTRSCLDLCT